LEADNYINEQFDVKHDMDVLIENDFPKIRCRLRKILFDENNKEEPILCPEKRFSVEVYNVILDQTISSIKKTFSTNCLYKDLNFLSPNNFEDLQKQNLPPNAKKLYEFLCKFDSDISYDQLRAELHSFIKNWNVLKKSLPESFDMPLNENEIEIEENNEENNTVKLECKSCKNCVVCCYNVLIKYNLYSNAYHCLAMAYQYLLTLPCTQVPKYTVSSFILF